MIPAALVGQLQQGLADFLRASFASTTPGFESLIDKLVAADGELMKGPYVQVFLPFEKGSTREPFPDLPLGFVPHKHQERAFERLGGDPHRSTLVATGTGSGKTESFLFPILAHCLANVGKPGIKAILIYPMNALASDQALRLARIIHRNPKLNGAVRAGLYVGEGEGKGRSPTTAMGPEHLITDHERLRRDPPDILLTNYKMLDYLLVRPRDRRLWQGSVGGSLRYLVVDELHTFDGAQGTDLAALVRRLKNRLGVAPGDLCCVGTSATLGGDAGGKRLRDYAEQVFGEPFDEGAVITESRIDVDAFRAEVETSVESVPPPSPHDLDPAHATEPAPWLDAVARQWLDTPPSGPPGSAEWTTTLGAGLLRHRLLDSLLRQVATGPRAIGELVAALAPAWPVLADPAQGRVALLSFLSLVSAARRWRADRSALEPFLQVRLQLWQREMRRMVATVEPTPTLRFSDDLLPAQRSLHLPVVHCRECGAMGWASLVTNNTPWLYRVELKSFYPAFFADDSRIQFLFPSAPPGVAAAPRRLDRSTLCAVPAGVLIPDDQAMEVFAVRRTRTSATGFPKLDRTCPFCDYPKSMSLLGYQAATLTSVFIDQLFASPFNDDKKLLTFSDSVQDAAHRAGFFGARTWRVNLRIATQRVVEAEGEGTTLADLPARLVASWRASSTEGEFLANFIAPDMLWMREWEALQKSGSLPAGSTLPTDVARRLVWEIHGEYGLNARIGRSLPRTMCSTAAVDARRLDAAVADVLPRLQNEVGGLRDLDAATARSWLAGVVQHMRERGAVFHAEIPQRYWADEEHFVFNVMPHLPSAGGHSRLPAFVTTRSRRGRFDDLVGTATRSSWYEEWSRAHMGGTGALVGEPADALPLVMAALVRAGIVEERISTQGASVWGLRGEALLVTCSVRELRCDECRHTTTVAGADVPSWEGVPCLSARCSGRMRATADGVEDRYFGRLYRRADVQRIFAEEHTGLLTRDQREDLEARFKTETNRKPWYPNLLSSTPTLEMGIDIGDLSTAVLCSVPPASANYVQRVGRAGRRDGNALILAIANARNHDLYFYGEPEEMVAGEVAPPGVYLNASSVLKRQLAAFCFDRWAAGCTNDDDLPKHMRKVYEGLSTGDEAVFPHNWRAYVESHTHELIDDFLAMFGDRILPATAQRIREHARPSEDGESFVWALLNELHAERTASEDLRKKVRQLGELVKEKKKQLVRDNNYDKELGELERESSATIELREALDRRDPLQFFTDEGLLPNYAFPEAPVRLKSVIWRRKSVVKAGENPVETLVFEYDRPSAVAIAELAPDNEFYASGRKVVIDQVDISTLERGKWRFCDDCSHSEVELPSESPKLACPACGSTMWPDPGQLHDVLKLRAVYANTKDKDSRLSDDSDVREPKFYTRQTLMTFKDADRGGAWRVAGLPFAFEYLRLARFREVNFGRHSATGTPSSVAGLREVRTGFQICQKCGKVQDPNEPPKHTFTCPERKQPTAAAVIGNNYFLYREFESEAVRMLLPIASFGTNQELASFIAAIQVGLRAYFGGRIDHLRALVSSEPVSGLPLRRQYLVLFDTVPGGTGYLQELTRVPDNLREVLKAARERLVRCSCATDPQRDGCYRCLFLYRNSNDMADISRIVAVGLLSDILNNWEPVEPVSSIGTVSINGLLGSLLEARFLEALRRSGTAAVPSTVVKSLVNGKPGWRWTIGDRTWNVEPQREHKPGDGFGVSFSIDFVLHPTSVASGERPVAVLLDGWVWHRDQVGMDMLRRMLAHTSGRYDVWSFTWDDVSAALGEPPPPTSALEPLLYADPSRLATVLASKALGVPHPLRMRLDEPSFRWFVDTLSGQYPAMDAHRLAWATLFSQLGECDAATWGPAVAALPTDVRVWLEPGGAVRTWQWAPDDARRATVLAVGTRDGLKADLAQLDSGTSADPRWVVVLHDDAPADEAVIRRTWAGLLRLANFARPLTHVWLLSRSSVGTLDFGLLRAMRETVAMHGEPGPWDEIERDVTASVRLLVRELRLRNVHVPEVGADLPDANGDALGPVGELVWSAQRVAVVIAPLDAAVRAKLAPGWQLFVAESIHSDVDALVDALSGTQK